MDFADADLVLARINTEDALHARAVQHMRLEPGITVPNSVALELLLVARKKGLRYADVITATDSYFEVETREVFLTAAALLDKGRVRTPFDAVHVAVALHRGGRLHTADKRLQRAGLPTLLF